MHLRSLRDLNESSLAWRPRDPSAAQALATRHTDARLTCASRSRPSSSLSASTTLASGGWCLRAMARARTFGHEERSIALEDGTTYSIPDTHVQADSIILSLLHSLLHPEVGPTLSVSDFGCGVGQYGYGLRVKDPSIRYQGYDGAGDVEEYTNGYVRFADFTIPLAFPRTDWVLSLEVGEHIPRRDEYMFLRNLHAHNCRGLVLSWAMHGGHQHVNKRPNDHVIDLFRRLGYRHDVKLSDAMRSQHVRRKVRPEQQQPRGNLTVYGWFAHTVMVFERYQRIRGEGCT
ncbi:MAG: hypothetical protein SGPRY_013935 [Prymnesium sp.]